jgi:hypothetical protein
MKQERDLETTCSTFSVDLYPIIHCGSKDHILNRVRNLYIIIDADMATMQYVHAWCMDWRRWSPARFSKSRRRSKVDPVRVPEVEAKSNLSSGPVQSPGAVPNKTDAQVAYGVGFGRSIYGWMQNFIELPMAPVSCQKSS